MDNYKTYNIEGNTNKKMRNAKLLKISISLLTKILSDMNTYLHKKVYYGNINYRNRPR